MRKPSPNPPTTLRHPDCLRGLNTLIERVLRIYEVSKRTPKSASKPLGKTA